MLDMTVVRQEVLELAVIHHDSKGRFVYAMLNDERVDKLTDVFQYIEACGFTRMQAFEILAEIRSELA